MRKEPAPLVVEPVYLVSQIYDRRTHDACRYVGLRLTREGAERLLVLTRSAEAADRSLGVRAGECMVTFYDATNAPFAIELAPEARAEFERHSWDWVVVDPEDVRRDFGRTPMNVLADCLDIAWEEPDSCGVERTFRLRADSVVAYLAGEPDAFPRLGKEEE